MSLKMKKYSFLVIAAVLLIAMAFAGAASADNWTDTGKFNASWYDAEGGASVSTYHIYDAASLAALSEKVTVNASPSDFHGKTILIMNDINLVGHDWTPIGNVTYNFNGTVDGNYRTISGFNIEEGSSINIGLIGLYAGNSIKNLTLKNFSVFGSSFVGGLVGKSLGINQIFENVTVEFGNVTGSICEGGLIGSLNDDYSTVSANFTNCTAKNCVVYSIDETYGYVGGLVGSAPCVSFDICKVVNCSVSGVMSVGGLVGYVNNANGSPFMHGSSVTNSIVSSGSNCVGGLVGTAEFAAASGIAACMVENCTIVSIGSDSVGGLVGAALIASVFNESISELKGSAVRGLNSDEDFIGKIVGCNEDCKKDSDDNVTCDSNIWLNNNSNADYPKIYIAKSINPDKQGPEVSDFFNNDTVADAVPAGAKLVTQLTGYGPNGKYAALAYVFEPPTLYSIYITNATGTYQLTSLLTTVCGDYGNSDNGTAVLTFDTESKPVLTLNGFKASNMSGVPIINTSVADLTIVLNDDSNLAGSIQSSGKLTIVKGEDGSELVVNNTASSSPDVISINAKSLTIDNAKVTAIANNTGIGIACALNGQNVQIIGSDAVVEANATSAEHFAHSIMANTIKINSSAKVTVTAKTEGNSYPNTAHGLYDILGNIIVSDSAEVIAVVNSSKGSAYAISDNNGGITIDNAKVTATANGKNETFAIVSNNNTIQIADGSEVDAYAASSAGNASAIIAHAKDITIDSGAQVIANVSAFENAFAIKSEKSNVSITGANTVVKANATSSNTNYNHPYNAFSIVADGKLAIDSGANVSAGAHHTGSGAAISFSGKDIGIADTETVIFAFAETESYLMPAIAILGNNISVTSVKKLTAIGSEDIFGSSSSFGYNLSGTGSLDMAGLVGYTFSNAIVSGAEPKSYATFIAPGNWHTVDMSILSNYTAVTIEKKDTPTPSYSGSTKQTGYTQIVQNVPTTTPTVAPTATPTQAPSTPSAPSASSGQAAQPTQSSPVPVAGIIAGFGAAALVLTRLRR